VRELVKKKYFRRFLRGQFRILHEWAVARMWDVLENCQFGDWKGVGSIT
jgi:hypothetical protein